MKTASHCLNQSSQYPYVFVNDVLGFSAGPDVDVDFYLLDRRLQRTPNVNVSTLDFIREQMSYGQSWSLKQGPRLRSTAVSFYFQVRKKNSGAEN